MQQEIDQFQKYYDIVITFFVNYSFQIIGALFILLIGVWFAGKIGKLINQLLLNKHLDDTLAHFLSNFVKIILIVMVVIVALGKVGISITPFVAAIGAASLGAGLAFQGLLSNYGAGLAIIFGRHFKVGDTITVKGVRGIVRDITLANTVLANYEGEEILIPNRHIIGDILENSFKQTMYQGEVGISYGDDPEQAVKVILHQAQQFVDREVREATEVGIERFDDSAITIRYRTLLASNKFHQLKFKLNMAIFKSLQKENITIPFPQRDLHIKEQPDSNKGL